MSTRVSVDFPDSMLRKPFIMKLAESVLSYVLQYYIEPLNARIVILECRDHTVSPTLLAAEHTAPSLKMLDGIKMMGLPLGKFRPCRWTSTMSQ